jgi:hypothetical protein
VKILKDVLEVVTGLRAVANFHATPKRFQNKCISASDANSPRSTCCSRCSPRRALHRPWHNDRTAALNLSRDLRKLILVVLRPRSGIFHQFFKSKAHAQNIVDFDFAATVSPQRNKAADRGRPAPRARCNSATCASSSGERHTAASIDGLRVVDDLRNSEGWASKAEQLANTELHRKWDHIAWPRSARADAHHGCASLTHRPARLEDGGLGNGASSWRE